MDDDERKEARRKAALEWYERVMADPEKRAEYRAKERKRRARRMADPARRGRHNALQRARREDPAVRARDSARHATPEVRAKNNARYARKASDPQWSRDYRARQQARKAARWGLAELVPANSVCALCGTGGTERNYLVRDHDHGKPDAECARDVLCVRCNTRLGVIEKHGHDWFAAAVQYLLRWDAPSVDGILLAIEAVVRRPAGEE